MKLFVASFLFAVASAGRLENTYLPPNSASGAGGNGNFLNAPRAHAAPAPPSTNYGVPSSNYGAPSNIGGSNARFGAQTKDGGAITLRLDNENNGDGTYRFQYETDNSINQEESGELKSIGNEQAVAVRGSYSYTGPDGVQYTVNYIADETGFHATGAHIPTPPPVPEAIQKSLEKIAASGNQGYDNGNYQNGNSYQGNNNYQSNNGYQNNNGFGQATNRQYLAPNKPNFNHKSGYNY